MATVFFLFRQGRLVGRHVRWYGGPRRGQEGAAGQLRRQSADDVRLLHLAGFHGGPPQRPRRVPIQVSRHLRRKTGNLFL